VFGLRWPFGSAATSTGDAQLKLINLSGLFAIEALLDLMLDTMVSFAEEGMTMICVTREMGFARQVANRLVFMDAGQIVEVNVPDAFFHAPQHRRTQRFSVRSFI